MPDLASIIIKVRRLTRSLTAAQITDLEIKNYINEFILYNMPSKLRTFNYRREFTFYTEPNVGKYTTSTVPGNDLYNFKQANISIHAPFFIGGAKVNYTQSLESFKAQWSGQTSLTTVATGNNVLVNFTGTLASIPLEPGNVLFTSKTTFNFGLRVSDDGDGAFTGDGVGTINYLTGAYNITFSAAPAASTDVVAQVRAYQPARPTSVLFFADIFTLRPIPDQVYKVTFQVNVRPTELDVPGDQPDLWENASYIAYGAARIILQERSEYEILQQIEPEFREQETYALRRTLVQLEDQRAATIYSSQIDNSNPWTFWR